MRSGKGFTEIRDARDMIATNFSLGVFAESGIIGPMPEFLTNERWCGYEQQGYLHLGRLLDEAQLEALRQRMDDLMLGRIATPRQLQLDTGGAYNTARSGRRSQRSHLSYRKVQGLEADTLVLSLLHGISSANLRPCLRPARQHLDFPRHDDEQTRRSGYASPVASGRR